MWQAAWRAAAAPRQHSLIRGTLRPALRAQSFVSICVACTDLALLALLLHGFVAVATQVAFSLSFQDQFVYTLFGLLAAVTFAARQGIFEVGHLLQPRQAAARALPAMLAAIGAIAFALAITGRHLPGLVCLALAAAVLGAIVLRLSRESWGRLIQVGVASGGLRYRVAIVGGESEVIARYLAAAPSPLLETVAVFDGPGPRPETPVGCFEDLLSLARTERVDAIVMAYAPGDTARLRAAFSTLRCSVADIFLANALPRCGMLPAGHPLAALPVIPVQRRPMTDIDTAIKGVVDRLAGCTLLLVLSPLLALTALAIIWDSPGPVLFRQPRVGYNNALFMMFKFRSMYDHATDPIAHRQTRKGDPRVTRVGRFIRRYSIDELPQLLNVIRGEMSVVGPRPHAPGTNVDGLLLEHVAAGYPLRHRVLPGITGLAQISGCRGILSSPEQIRQRVKLDLEYIDRWSLLLDLKIVWLTAIREIWSRHAY
jgi:exopolysaccharide biosynthesis polyprenyl glycosylphosphotransferase